MKRLFWLVLILVAAALAAVVIDQTPGYLLLQLRHISVAVPLWLAIVALALVVVGVIVIGRLLRWMFAIPLDLQQQMRERNRVKQSQWLREGLTQWLLEDWQSVEKTFKRLSASAFWPRICLLLVAKVASHQRRSLVENDYLNRAMQLKDGTEQWLVDLVHADTLLAREQWAEARQVLTQIAEQQPHNPFVAKRLLKLDLRDGCWPAALQAVTLMRKAELLSRHREHEYLLIIYRGMVSAAYRDSAVALQAVWADLPEAWQRDSSLLLHYAKCLLALRQDSTLEAVLRKALKQSWNEDLFVVYCQCRGQDPSQQITLADAWFKQAPQTAQTLLGMGYLCAHQQLVGRAKHYFQSSLQLAPSAQAYQALAGLLAKEQQFKEAVAVFQQAAAVAQLPSV